MTRVPALLVFSVALLAAACTNPFSSQTTSPDPTNLSTGQWTSVSSATTLTNTCTNFRWTITTITTTTVSGPFTATCMSTMPVTGTAHGDISGDTIAWTANATGTAPNMPSCAVTLTSTATYDGTQFRVPFTGTTCLGPVSGAEILRKM